MRKPRAAAALGLATILAPLTALGIGDHDTSYGFRLIDNPLLGGGAILTVVLVLFVALTVWARRR